jgi:hypothetical protein
VGNLEIPSNAAGACPLDCISDRGNSWSFGQIVAIAIFLPALVESVYVYSKGPLETENGPNGQGRGVRSPSPGGASI